MFHPNSTNECIWLHEVPLLLAWRSETLAEGVQIPAKLPLLSAAICYCPAQIQTSSAETVTQLILPFNVKNQYTQDADNP